MTRRLGERICVSMLALWWMYDRVARSCLHHVRVEIYFVNFDEVLLEVFEDVVVSWCTWVYKWHCAQACVSTLCVGFKCEFVYSMLSVGLQGRKFVEV